MNEINVARSSMPPFEEYCEEIQDLWDSRWLTNMGKKHEELRSKLQEYLGVRHLDLLTNGHMAIELSLQALGLTGEAITTPFTFASTTQAIVRNGLLPVSSKLMDYRGNSGYFYEFDCDDILALRDFCGDTRCQTVGLLGEMNLVEPLLRTGIRGVDRIYGKQ